MALESCAWPLEVEFHWDLNIFIKLYTWRAQSPHIIGAGDQGDETDEVWKEGQYIIYYSIHAGNL